MASGMIISVAFWDVWSTATNFVSDMEGDQTIKYYLTLPVPAWLYFIKQIVYFAIRGGLQGIVMLPFGKLVLLDRFDLSNFNAIQFIFVFISANVFCATLSLIMSSMVKNMNNVGDVGVRFLFPMWFLGGSQFSWQTLYGFSPKFAYLCLLNPLLYAMEAMRAAILGQAGYLPFWLSIFILWIFNILFSWYGIVRMKKRLDCV
jgi:ABC-2 type transport system permease protein